ncbi:hypothetical protein GF406_16720 [candidate division KSB1 bacterium]|jgi:hypothetical protein|nr:hypothetical protein [candidate division KSB1 bacterium]
MILIRLLLLGIMFYLASKVLALIFKPSAQSDVEIKGESESKPLDLDENDIDDVDYKDLNE